MLTTPQKVLVTFLFLNAVLVITFVVGSSQNFSIRNTKMVSLAILNSPNLRGSSIQEDTDFDAIESLAGLLDRTNHPFDQLSKKLTELDWDPKLIDEFIRQYWKTERTFLEKPHKFLQPKLSTSCLHTAAWIVVGLLELQTRENMYIGLWKRPKNKDFVVYENYNTPPSTLAAPVIDSIKSFVDSKPKNESILLQVDMYQIKNTTGQGYIDHHFAIHIYNGSISLYQGWQDVFTLIDWMREPGSHKQRYSMPLDTFFGHFEKFLTYDQEKGHFDRERLYHTWEIFGITEEFVFAEKKTGLTDPIVRALRYPWVVSQITHWPSPVPEETTGGEEKLPVGAEMPKF